MPTEADIAWATGLFEGEGSFGATTHKKTGRTYTRLAMKMTDLDVIQEFEHVVGCGRIRKSKTIGIGRTGIPHKQQYEWYTTSTDDFLKAADLLRPRLMPRRLAQLEALEAQRSPIRKPWLQGRRAGKGMGRTSPAPAKISGQLNL